MECLHLQQLVKKPREYEKAYLGCWVGQGGMKHRDERGDIDQLLHNKRKVSD